MTPTAAPVVTQDEQDYSTLKVVRARLQAALDDLKSDYNLLEIPVDKLITDVVFAQTVGRQIALKQDHHALVAELIDDIDGAIEAVDNKHKQRNPR